MDLKVISNNLIFFITVIIMPLGILLNSFAIFVFTRPNLNKSTSNMSFLSIIQLIIDIMILLSNIFIFRSVQLFKYDIYSLTEFGCRFLNLYRRFILHASSWTALFITFDRFLFIIYRSMFNIMSKKRIILIVLGSIYLLLFCLNGIHFFYFLEINQTFKNSSESNITRKLVCKSSFEIDLASDIMTLLLRTYIPVAIMVVLNMIIIRIVLISKSKMGSKKKKSSKETKFTLSVILSNIFFILFFLPLLIFYILYYVHRFSGKIDKKYEQDLDFYYQCALIFAYFYQCFEFFIIYMFNILFRNEVMIIFRVKKNLYGA
jgi:hypothetical protein